jgi:hypothetical protein
LEELLGDMGRRGSSLSKVLLYIGGGVAVVSGLEGGLVLVLDLSSVVGGFELFDLDRRALGREM